MGKIASIFISFALIVAGVAPSSAARVDMLFAFTIASLLQKSSRQMRFLIASVSLRRDISLPQNQERSL